MSETARCRNPDCRRPIRDAAKYHGFGPKCWRKHLAAQVVQAVIPLGDTRRWNDDMPGQNEITTEETTDGER